MGSGLTRGKRRLPRISISVAAARGDVAVLCALLRKQNPDGEADGGKLAMTPLCAAAANGHTACVRVLLKAGANPDLNEQKDGLTPVMLAVKHGHFEAAEVLIRAGCTTSAAASTYDGRVLVDIAREALERRKECPSEAMWEGVCTSKRCEFHRGPQKMLALVTDALDGYDDDEDLW